MLAHWTKPHGSGSCNAEGVCSEGKQHGNPEISGFGEVSGRVVRAQSSKDYRVIDDPAVLIFLDRWSPLQIEHVGEWTVRSQLCGSTCWNYNREGVSIIRNGT